ncbi:MAG: hypothetical protein B7C55_04525 [Actinomycetales bacterium mxb001]|nr:MAG: hypothetical protein B7C55_04525 [Actinomycetales bacterium mxb001]
MTVAAPVEPEARLRVMAARVIAQQRWPYVSNLLFNFKLVEVPHEVLPTMAVDKGWRLYYSPVFVGGETPEALATVLLHECLHCLHDHSDRFVALKRPSAEHPLWNYAGDAAINAVLDDGRMPWPTVTPVRYSDLSDYGVAQDMSTEAAFFALINYRDENPRHSLEHYDCGSVSGGDSRGYELPAGDPEAPAIRSDQQDIIRDRVAHDILTHARDRGNVPGGLLRWAQRLLDPKVNWREALASRLRRDLASVAGRRDYVYTRPSRRQEAMRLAGSSAILPAMRQPAPPRVACVIDTSGSIAGPEIRDFLAEVVGITRASGVSGGVTVIPCDANAYTPRRVRSASEAESLELEGGGGTDMGVGIEAASALRPRAQIIVVFTDGYTAWPSAPPPRIDAVIVVLSAPESLAHVPEWAHVILLE